MSEGPEVLKKDDLLALARAAIAVAEGEKTPDDFPPAIAIKLGEVSIETVELNQGITKVSVRQFAAAVVAFEEILLEQGITSEESAKEKRKAVWGQLAVTLDSTSLGMMLNLFSGAAAIRQEMQTPDPGKEE